MNIVKRNDLFDLLIQRGLTSRAVEIGVAEGGYSFYLLDCIPGMICYQVDAWAEMDRSVYSDYNNVNAQEHLRRYALVLDTAATYRGRAVPIRAFSAEAATMFPDSFVDFVYIDANHKLEFIRQDLALWWPKLKPGGLFAGHDYLDGVIKSGEYGVKQAVDEFAARNNLKINVTAEPDYPSWWAFKP